MTAICIHCYISGRVQGVFYRRGTYEKSLSLSIKGWVQNLADGRVEAVLCGEPDALELMKEWLWEGPAAARVDNVEIKEIPFQTFEKFEMR